MKKILAFLSLCAFSIGVIALLFWSGEASETSHSTRSKSAAKTQKTIDLHSPNTAVNDLDSGPPPIEKAAKKTASNQSAQEPHKKAHKTRVEFRTCLPNGKHYDMPVEVEQNGEIYGGTEMIVGMGPFDLEPGEATASCTVDSMFRNIGQGQSDPVTFIVNGKAQQVVDLTLRDAPGYYIDLKNSDPKNDTTIYYDVIYDETGSMTDSQIRETAILSDFMARLPAFKIGIKAGLYYLVASTVPYRIEFIKAIHVGTRFESRSFTLPKALSDDHWRFVKVIDATGNPVTNAQFRAIHNFKSTQRDLGNQHSFTPAAKHLGQGLYKLNIPLTTSPAKDYESSQLRTLLGSVTVATTAFQLDQNNIEVVLPGKANIEFSIELKGRKNQQIIVAVEGPGSKTMFRYSEKRVAKGLNAGKYFVKVFLKQSESMPLQREGLLRVLVYQKQVDLAQGQNSLPMTIEIYDREIQTKTPESYVVAFPKNGQRDHPWLGKTDADGRVTLENLIPGQYILEINKSKEKLELTVP